MNRSQLCQIPRCEFRYALRTVILCAASLFICLASCANVSAADRREAEKLFATGEYEACLKQATEGVADYRFDERWWRLKLQSELMTGKYAEAKETLETALKTHSASIVLRYLGHRVYSLNNDPETAKSMFDQIDERVRNWPSRYSDSESSLVLGRMLLASGADARKVLEMFYDRAKRLASRKTEVYLAAADLSLQKFAFDLAAKELQTALEIDPENAGVHYRLALAFESSNAERATTALNKALEINPNHIDSHLLAARNAISGERYGDAKEIIDKVIAVNPKHEIGWSLRAVIAHLEGDEKRQKECYDAAIAHWPNNPEVDHEIGKQLSRKYRFSIGAKFQRRALEKSVDHLPAKLQLAQDLLRLGDDQGWQLAREVNEIDGYNVVMHNLMTLHDHLKDFRTIEDSGIIVRMSDREAELYGDEVVALLAEARDVLTKKYEVKIDKPVIVEIFPQQADFAIRTFGLPGGDGFLGVCFGRVITANSPASRKDSPSNWEAVLWHEFCHAVTLEKTENRMPRWFSEGISVYEERQRDSAWGEKMNPTYRKMILGDDLTPVSQLSQAFLSPKTARHLQFAYLESSLVVEYLVEKYGQETINRILTDLGAGMPINESLRRYVDSLDALDKEFATYAIERAKNFGKDVDWEEPKVNIGSSLAEIEAWNKEHKNSYDGLRLYALKLLEVDRVEEARDNLRKIIKLVPLQTGTGNAWQILSATWRKFDNDAKEIDALNEWIKNDSDAIEAYSRLIEINEQKNDWDEVARAAKLLMAVDPLDRRVHLASAAAAENRDDADASLRSLRRLLQFETTDLADTHYRVAKLLSESKQTDDAKKHILMALEEAPRFRDAHRLLLKLHENDSDSGDDVDENGIDKGEGKSTKNNR